MHLGIYTFSAQINEKSLILCFAFADLGLQERRLDGHEYVAVIDEFMDGVFTRWPNVVVQVGANLLGALENSAASCNICLLFAFGFAV